MLRRFLVVALLLPFSAVLLFRHASAQSIGPDDLTSFLLSANQLNSALSSVGLDANFTRATDGSPQTGDRVGTCRTYASDAGYAAAICLFANADGSAVSGDLRNTILSGDAIQNVAQNTGLVDTIANFSLLGGLGGVGDGDQLATFSATSSGADLDVIADVFIQKAVTGYVYFAATSNPDATTMGAILGLQSGILP
jgi:hypothetical protein